MATEQDIARGVMIIAAGQPNGIASFNRCRREIPGLVRLNAANNAPSPTRPGEPMWHQIVRNIKSHDIAGTNYIAQGLLVHVPRVGYEITYAGRAHLRGLRLHP
jgi:hypothetical protein